LLPMKSQITEPFDMVSVRRYSAFPVLAHVFAAVLYRHVAKLLLAQS
jgi:hypothetical protein